MKGSKSAARELDRDLKKLAKQENLPIYLETAMPVNRKVYERFGYETYDEWIVPEEDIQFWFLRWLPPFYKDQKK